MILQGREGQSLVILQGREGQSLVRLEAKCQPVVPVVCGVLTCVASAAAFGTLAWRKAVVGDGCDVIRPRIVAMRVLRTAPMSASSCARCEVECRAPARNLKPALPAACRSAAAQRSRRPNGGWFQNDKLAEAQLTALATPMHNGQVCLRRTRAHH